MRAPRRLLAVALLLAAACGEGDRPAAVSGRVIPNRQVNHEQGNRIDPDLGDARRPDLLP
jgi:hypothetical protein